MGLLLKLSSTLITSVNIWSNFLKNYELSDIAAEWIGEQKLGPLFLWIRLNFLRWLSWGIFPIKRS